MCSVSWAVQSNKADGKIRSQPCPGGQRPRPSGREQSGTHGVALGRPIGRRAELSKVGPQGTQVLLLCIEGASNPNCYSENSSLLSHSSPVQLFTTPWTEACQTPLSMRFPRQEYWSGLPFPSPRDLPDQEMEPVSPALAGRSFTTEPPGKPRVRILGTY